MKLAPQITFRHLEPNTAIRAAVQARVDDLDHFFEGIMGCRVTVEAPHRRHHKGNLYRVLVDITVPGEELVAGHHTGQNEAHEDIYVAIRDAFDAADRQLQDYVRRRRRQVKEPVRPPHGTVARIGADYGFLIAEDGHEIYFHRNSVIGDFDELAPGDEVRFAEEMGDEGPQASTVHPVGKSGHVGVSVGNQRV